MDNEEESKEINVRDWITLSTIMIGAVLTILALIWQVAPSSGIVSVSFLLMLSFILFVNSVSTNSRAKFDSKSNISFKQVMKWIRFAEYSFGLGFTFVICGFSILSYKYLLDFTNRQLIALILPISFLITTWALIFVYNVINYSTKAKKSFNAVRSLKRNIWILLEFGCLILIIFDYFEIILIP